MADWSSVYEETGEEVGDWERKELTTLRVEFNNFQNYSPLVAYFFTVNYILGVGCLGVPFAFQKCGVVLASLLIIFVSLISFVTVVWVADASYRGMVLMKERAKTDLGGISAERMKIGVKRDDKKYNSFIAVNEPRNDNRLNNGDDQSELEVTELAAEFLGPVGKFSYQSSLLALTFIGLLAYTQVFNDSFVQEIWPNCPQFIPVLLFGIVVIPFSCMDLVEQINAQIAMSLLRFLSIAVLIIATVIALRLENDTNPVTDSVEFMLDQPVALSSAVAMQSTRHQLPLANLSGFGIMFTTAIFSQLFQHSVPGLIRPLAPEHKKFVPQIFGYALLTTTVIYILIGITCVAYFGSNTKPSVNLNFIGFNWGLDANNALLPVVKFASMIVVLFPALDTLSVFPLIANTLGNSLHVFFPALGDMTQSSALLGHLDKNQRERVAIVVWRLVASAPPIFLSLKVKDLSLSLQLAGICGVVVALVIPALLNKETLQRTAPQSPPYSNHFKSPIYSNVTLIIASTAVAVCISQIAFPS